MVEIDNTLHASGNGYRVEPPGPEFMPLGSNVSLPVRWDGQYATVRLGPNVYRAKTWLDYEQAVGEVLAGRLTKFRYWGNYLMIAERDEDVGVLRTVGWKEGWQCPWQFWEFSGLETKPETVGVVVASTQLRMFEG